MSNALINTAPALALSESEVRKYFAAVREHMQYFGFDEDSHMHVAEDTNESGNFEGTMKLLHNAKAGTFVNIGFSADPDEAPEMQDDRIRVMIYSKNDRPAEGARFYKEYLNVDQALAGIPDIDWNV